MKINSTDIFLCLAEFNIKYNLSGKVDVQYGIASLFEPINSGFYFFTGLTNFPDSIKNSLILVNSKFEISSDENTYLEIYEDDPQRVYYQILSKLYSRKSTGTISNLTSISKDAEIGKNVQIDEFCSIENDVKIGNNVIISSHTRISKGTIIDDNVIIDCGSMIGVQGVAWVWNGNQTRKIIQPQLGGVHVKENTFLGAQIVIVRGSLNEKTYIGKNCLIAPGCKFGHGTKVSDFCHFANNITTGGNTSIGKYSFIGSAAVFRPRVEIHDKTVVGAGSLVIKNTTSENRTLMGSPAKEYPTKENPSGMPKPKQ